MVFVFNIFTMFVFSYICIYHFAMTRDEYWYFRDKFCGYMYPCDFFYSRFDKSLSVAFARTVMIFGFTGIGLFVYSWV